MKLYTLIGIFIKNHLEKFAGAAINIDKNYRPEYKFKFWFVNLSMIICKTQKFVIW